VAFWLAWRIVPVLERDREKPFDWPGFLLTGGGLFGLMAAAEILSRPEAAWSRAALALAVGLMAAGVVHLKRAARPMLDLTALNTKIYETHVNQVSGSVGESHPPRGGYSRTTARVRRSAVSPPRGACGLYVGARAAACSAASASESTQSAHCCMT
ncbi:MAG: hypothetical protein QM661_04580, partial [Solimonas sp.]